MFNEKTKLSRLQRLMVAVTFAEAVEYDTVLEMMGHWKTKRPQKCNKHRQEKRIDRRPVLMV